MEALVGKVHKQGEHILQHCYISHNHPYIHVHIRNGDTLVGTISIFTATYVYHIAGKFGEHYIWQILEFYISAGELCILTSV